MKIRVETQERSFTIPGPTALIFSDGITWVAELTGKKYAGEFMKGVSQKDMKRLFAEIRKIKKRYGPWELVDVQSADGKRIRITL